MQQFCYKCLKTLDNSANNMNGLHNQCFLEWFNLKFISDFGNVTAKGGEKKDEETTGFSKINSSFFHGKFRKYSAELGKNSYILKVKEEDYPELPPTEYLCNLIADSLKINIPDFYLLNYQEEITFVSKNFVKGRAKENLVHIYRYFKENEEFNCINTIEIIKRETGKLKEIERFIELCLFDSLIGNHDRHGRNLAIVQRRGIKKLSPFYDNVSYIGVETENLLGAEHEPKGKISTKLTDEPTMKDYVKEFISSGYDFVIKKFYEKVSLPFIEELIGKAFISDKRKIALKRIVFRRYGELKHGIKK